MTLAEAFADDDVVEQFKEEKKRAIDASAPKAIDLTLPGWGEWGGSGLKVSRRKKKRFIIAPPPVPKRKDENQGNLILNDDKNPAMRKQQACYILPAFSGFCFRMNFTSLFDLFLSFLLLGKRTSVPVPICSCI